MIDWHSQAVFVGLLVTIVTAAWKLGRQAERIESSVKNFEVIPLMHRDIEQLKDTVARSVSDIRELKEDKAARDAVARWSQGDVNG